MSEHSLIYTGPMTLNPAIETIPSIPRRRAPALAPQDRRVVIIAATVPLLREHGASVTTSQIAQAAGIAEGTIFRVFPNKQELLLAALRTALSADAEVERIGAISMDTPLTERLVAAVGAVSEYQQRLWWVMRALQDIGWRHRGDDHDVDEDSPRGQMRLIAIAIAALFEPQADSFRLEPRPAARMLLALAFTTHLQEHGLDQPASTAEQVVDIFLHGALRQTEAGARTGESLA